MHLIAASFVSVVPLKRQRLINKTNAHGWDHGGCHCPWLGPKGLRQLACDLELPLTNPCKQAEASADVSRGPALGITEERIRLRLRAESDRVSSGMAGKSEGVRALLWLTVGHNHASGNVSKPEPTVWCGNSAFQAFQAPGVIIFALNGPTCLTDTQ